MAKNRNVRRRVELRFGWKLSFLLSIPMALMLFVTLTGGDDVFAKADTRFAFASIWILDVFLFYRMLRTGRTDIYRAVLFIAFAIALSATFIDHMFESRGNMTFSHADLLQCKVPFCHIVTTMILIPAAIGKSIIFPGSIDTGFANISVMLVLITGALLTMGRGFCAWGCFYGGWDDGFSRLRRRARLVNLPLYLRWGGFAVLIIVALSSAATLVPTYCDWVCPFKAVTEFEEVTDHTSAAKAVVFASLFSALVIALPVMTKKRTQCAWFCPMGALCSLTNPVNIFQIRIDKTQCVRCGKCIKSCPVQALDQTSLDSGKPSIQCLKCGKCADVCPRKCIGFHLIWTRILSHPRTARLLFLYCSFGFLAVFSGRSLQNFILLVLNLIERSGRFFA